MAQTPSLTNYAEIQENEIKVLESIFIEDFVEEKAKAGAWNKKADRAFRLKLKPPSTDEDELSTTLRVSLPATYPKTQPKWHLEFNGGVPGKSRKQISEAVATKSKELLGQEMIYEMVIAIQEALDDAASSIAQIQDIPALDEERAQKEAEVLQREADNKAKEERKLKDAEDEEARNLAKMVEREQARLTRLHKESSKQRDSANTEEVNGSLTFDQPMKVKTSSGEVVAFRSISHKMGYRNGPLSSVFTACPVGSDKDHQPSLVLKEYSITASGSEEDLKKSLQSLEVNLEALVKLPSHPTVLKPIGYRIERPYSSSSPSGKGWNISILLNYVQRGSLRDILELVGHLEMQNARAWTIQILEGLDFLHRHRVVHAKLSPDNVLLERTELGSTIVKLSDILYQHEISVMKHQSSTKFSSSTSAYWVAPEAATNTTARPATPRDIWDFGVLLLQAVFGLDVQRQYNSPNALMEALNISETFEQLLTKIFRADPKKRPSAFGLLADEFLRNNDSALDEDSSPPISKIASSSSYIPPKPFRSRHDSNYHVNIGASRYENDFVEAGRLGKGGFGEVVRARNKLDGTMYAIKKITQSSTAALSGVLSEVMLLSRLNNPFIVRYYTAWIEEEGSQHHERNSLPSDSSSSDESISQLPMSSTQGLDFISSGRYAAVEFGYDSGDEAIQSDVIEDDGASDEDEEDDREEESKAKAAIASRIQRRRSSAGLTSQVTLYIQMEYCEKHTLGDLIRGDLHTNVEEIWRLFRQILEGLAHVHSNGVIHRDMKPANIFISLDESNTVRIGDFGLARPGEASNKAASKGFLDPRLTASIGTSVYVAPEVRSSGGGSYNDKADMYSLGVILFEMSYPLKTAMERADTLESLRQNPCVLPSAFDEAEKHVQGEIIRSLLCHKVSERPSSQELLRSGKIPSYVEDETIQTALRSLSDRSSPFYSKLMNGLFTSSREDSTAKDFTYDLEVGLKYDSESLLLQSLVKDKLIEVFHHHGAVEVRRPTLIPNSHHYGEAAAVRLLNSGGSLVQLPYDLTLPFARTLAKPTLKEACRKSYAFGSVFRDAPAGLHPRMHGEVDFDIISNDSLDLALREAEVIKVVDEIMDVLPSLSNTPIVYHVSHSKLLNAVLAFCNIPEEKATSVKQVISKLNIGPWTWTKIRNELKSPALAIASTSLDDLMKFDFRDTYEHAVSKLRNILENTEELESTFRHLEAVITYLERFRVKRKVYLNPLATVNESFYRGNLLFQCIYDAKKKRVMCAGGRYDRLIHEQRTGAKSRDWHAVGFNLAWENLLESMARYHKNAGNAFVKKSGEAATKPWKARRCDVLVDSTEPALLRSTGIKIVQELWRHNISAELIVDAGLREATSHHHQTKDEGGLCHDWLVLIKQDETLKVRSMVGREDVEVRAAELVGWLRLEMRERDRLEGRAEKSRPQHHPGQQEAGGADRDADVTVLVAQSRGKKTNRRNVVDDAQARAQELAQSFLDGPIAAVEMKDDVFDGLRNTRLSDPDGWRRFIQSAPLAERQYLSQVHELLLEKAKEATHPARNAWIYNFRTRACLYYDLGRGT